VPDGCLIAFTGTDPGNRENSLHRAAAGCAGSGRRRAPYGYSTGPISGAGKLGVDEELERIELLVLLHEAVQAERHLSKLLRSAGPREEGQAPPLYLPLVLTELGFLAEQRGQAAEARQLHLRALKASRTLGERRGVALALEGLAGAIGLSGDYETSARLLGASGSARRAACMPSAPSEQAETDRIAAAARAALGEAAFATAYQHGSAQTPEDATALL
jgi:hypothetical protein